MFTYIEGIFFQKVFPYLHIQENNVIVSDSWEYVVHGYVAIG
jgi:hypothetical protein